MLENENDMQTYISLHVIFFRVSCPLLHFIQWISTNTIDLAYMTV